MPAPTREAVETEVPFADIGIISKYLNLSEILSQLLVRQDAQSPLDVEVPQIVIVGDQSHGKTSLVEGISGVKLPQGDGTKTKIPLNMKISSTRTRSLTRFRYYSATSPTQTTNWKECHRSEICNHVDQLTWTFAPAGNGLVLDGSRIEVEVYVAGLLPDTNDNGNKPILLLSVTDLPGMTRLAALDQHENIEDQITELYTKFIGDPNTIILNIIAATVDFSTSTSLKLSRKYDPLSKRTYIIVTKCDKEERTAANKVIAQCDMLNVPSNKVFFTMNNPVAQDLGLNEKWKQEALFFSKTSFSSIPSDRLGCQQLTKSLSIHHANMLSSSLPKLERQLRIEQRKSKKVLSAFIAEYGLSDNGLDHPATASTKFSRWSMSWIKSVENSLRGSQTRTREVPLCAMRELINDSFRQAAWGNELPDSDRDSIEHSEIFPSALLDLDFAPCFNSLKERLKAKIENTKGAPGMPDARDENTVMFHEVQSVIMSFTTSFSDQYIAIHRDSLLKHLINEMTASSSISPLSKEHTSATDKRAWPLLYDYIEESVLEPIVNDLAREALDSIKVLGECESRCVNCYSNQYHEILQRLKQDEYGFGQPMNKGHETVEQRTSPTRGEFCASPRLVSSIIDSGIDGMTSGVATTLTSGLAVGVASGVSTGVGALISREMSPLKPMEYSNNKMSLHSSPRTLYHENKLNDLALEIKAYWIVFINRYLDSSAILCNGLIYQRICDELNTRMWHILAHPPSDMDAWFAPTQTVQDMYKKHIEKRDSIHKALTIFEDIQNGRQKRDVEVTKTCDDATPKKASPKQPKSTSENTVEENIQASNSRSSSYRFRKAWQALSPRL